MIKTYYWRGKKNFGDLLTPLLLQRFCHLPSEWAQPSEAQLVMVGSVMEHFRNLYESEELVIAGAGFLHDDGITRRNTNDLILALRGPLSYRKVSGYRITGNVVLADPGLLADELVPEQEKIYDLGLVPHWSDTTLEKNPTFLKYKPKIIRVSDDPLEVIAQIGQCKKIVSSSLHGIILADAFGIPRRIEIPPLSLSNPKQEGGLFKWRDYTLSLGMELEVGKTQEVDRNVIIEKQHELFDVFEEVKSIFGGKN